jgi:mono/diheme cytochrome c family protein
VSFEKIFLTRRLWLAPLLALLMPLSMAAARAADDDGSAELGHDLYTDTCARCHGDNMVNVGGIAFDLRKFPHDDFARFKNSVLNGKNQGMPAWRGQVNDQDIADLWAYVKTGGNAP